jgi:hypothetical protein
VILETKMRFQLVVQIRGASLEDFNDMIAFEHDLIFQLGETAHVDEHDVGPRWTNIFVDTDDPSKTFLLIKALLERTQRLAKATVASRLAGSDRFTLLWPKYAHGEFVLE